MDVKQKALLRVLAHLDHQVAEMESRLTQPTIDQALYDNQAALAQLHDTRIRIEAEVNRPPAID